MQLFTGRLCLLLFPVTTLLLPGAKLLYGGHPASASSRPAAAAVQPGGNADTVQQGPDLESIDQNVVNFMHKYMVPALSIAITRNEKLVYAKSYGMADIGKKEPATNQSLYRLASLSKQITSAVIMKLMDQGKIRMEDKVFGPGAILGTAFGTQPYKPGVTDITIDELLHHTGGGWANDASYADPMFTHPRMNGRELISWTMDNMPLDHAPGTHYDYSNFGYCILGRVIEKITGESYQAAANSLILRPCGIQDMIIGVQRRKTNEVKYYSQSGEDPYGFNLARMDSHGGWLATATDLARFLVHIDGSGADVISPEAIAVMNTGSAVNPRYGCGWILTGPNRWHNGSLPGTQTEQAITKQRGAFNFVILTNTRSKEKGFGGDMDRIFWNCIAQTAVWPEVDLF